MFIKGMLVSPHDTALISGVGTLVTLANDDSPGTTEEWIVNFGDGVGTCTVHINDMEPCLSLPVIQGFNGGHSMCKIEKLNNKLSNDYKRYREKALEADKETLLNNSYYHAICGEWQCYLESWFGDGNGYGGFEERVINILLTQDNIFDALVGYLRNKDSIILSSDAFHGYLEEFAARVT